MRRLGDEKGLVTRKTLREEKVQGRKRTFLEERRAEKSQTEYTQLKGPFSSHSRDDRDLHPSPYPYLIDQTGNPFLVMRYQKAR